MEALKLLLPIILLLSIPDASSLDPIKCDPASKSCTLVNYQGLWVDRVPCTVSSVAYPTNEQELVAAVAGGVRRKQSIKVVSKLSHSQPKFSCPRGNNGLLISTSKYASNIVIDKAAGTVTVDAGVQLHDMLSKLAEQGLALPCTPTFSGLSVAGVVSTGAHGSSLQGRGGAVNEHVTGISIVVPATEAEGYAKVLRLTSADEDLNAAKLSLGVLGAISKVTLSVEPMFKRSVTKQARDDSTLESDVLNLPRNYAFPDVNWYVDQKRFIAGLTSKVPVSTPGQGKSTSSQPVRASSVKSWRQQEEALMAKKNASLVCAAFVSTVNDRVSKGDSFVNDDSGFKGYPVVGFNHQMQTAGGCQIEGLKNSSAADKLTCAWDPDVPGQLFFHTSIAVPASRISQAIRDVRQLRDKIPQKLCPVNQYGGVILRFVRGSSAYLASPQDSVFFEMMYFRDRRSQVPRLDEDGMEEVEQLLLKKYNGRPHWGKNRDSAFENIKAKVTNLPKFLEAKQRMDPAGYFSSEWSDAVLGVNRTSRSVSTFKDSCALEGLCTCSSDRHCAPKEGYFCRPGVLFKDARVCRNN